MRICCTKNRGVDLQFYEYETINDAEIFGRFGVSRNATYEIELGKEYFVMGIIIFKTYQAYLIDYNGSISIFPCQLFEIVDNRVNSNWHFRIIDIDEDIYPFIQCILGYYELCFDKQSYENLIVEKDEKAELIYFKRKRELYNET